TARNPLSRVVDRDLSFDLRDHSLRRIGGEDRMPGTRKVHCVDACAGVEFEYTAAGIEEARNMTVHLLSQIAKDNVARVITVIENRLLAECAFNGLRRS